MNSEATPGSKAAVKRGCICNADANRHGKGSPFGDGRFVIDAECPTHGCECTKPWVAAIQIMGK